MRKKTKKVLQDKIIVIKSHILDTESQNNKVLSPNFVFPMSLPYGLLFSYISFMGYYLDVCQISYSHTNEQSVVLLGFWFLPFLTQVTFKVNFQFRQANVDSTRTYNNYTWPTLM